jgi:hypothetical protein
MGVPQLLIEALHESVRVARNDDEVLARLRTLLALLPPVPLDAEVVAVLCGLSTEAVVPLLKRLEGEASLQPALPDGKVRLHDLTRRFILRCLQDDTAEWPRALDELLSGLQRLIMQLQGLGGSGASAAMLRWDQLRSLFYELCDEDVFRGVATERAPDVATLYLDAYAFARADAALGVFPDRFLLAAERVDVSGTAGVKAVCLLERGKLSAHACDWPRALAQFDEAERGFGIAGEILFRVETLICAAHACLASGKLGEARSRHLAARGLVQGCSFVSGGDLTAIVQLTRQLTLLDVELYLDLGQVLSAHTLDERVREIDDLVHQAARDQDVSTEWSARLLLVELRLYRMAKGDLAWALAECEHVLSANWGGPLREQAGVFAKFRLMRGVVKLLLADDRWRL